MVIKLLINVCAGEIPMARAVKVHVDHSTFLFVFTFSLHRDEQTSVANASRPVTRKVVLKVLNGSGSKKETC